MIIRKLFKFENAHIVRDCSSKRCKSSIHGHSYKAEVLLESQFLDNAGMVYDFGLMKKNIACLIDSFDHSTTIFDKDSQQYQQDMKRHSARWVSLPVNPSAEQFCRVFFVLIDALLGLSVMQNGERGVRLHSIIVHETDTGYAQCFRDDAYNAQMGEITLDSVVFSRAIIDEWEDADLYEKIKNRQKIINPKEV